MATRELSFIVFMLLWAETCVGNYDFFVLVLTWPPSIRPKQQTRFTIHGLWPNLNTGDWVIYCPGSPFDINKIGSNMLPLLEATWPDIVKPTKSHDFWKHEWVKHGTCSEYKMDQRTYFDVAYILHGKFIDADIFKKGRIVPGSGRTYSTGQINSLLYSQFGISKARVICRTQKNQPTQLTELWLCADADGNNFIDCPNAMRSSPCRDRFVVAN